MPEEKVKVRELLEKEAELQQLRKQYGVEKEMNWFEKAVDFLVNHAHEPKKVSRKTYLLLALTCGWFCGAHRFYSGHNVQGILYVLFSWTGISLAMTIIDVLLVFLKHEPDAEGMIEL